MYIHTFEVSTMLTKDNYFKVQEILKADNKWSREDKGMLYFGLSTKGLLIRMELVNKPGFNSYQLLYIISGRRVMDNDNYVGLFNSKDYDDLKEKVNNLLENRCPLLPKLKKCHLRRLDFCINIELDSQRQVEAYINTARRANIPKGMKRKETYDETGHRYKPDEDDMTVLSKNSDNNVAVSIYNKLAQMEKQDKYKYPKDALERAKNIVRIEIRCQKEKIKELKKKYEIKKISEFMARADKIGGELFRYYLSGMFDTATIRTLKDATDRIGKSNFNSEKKALLCEFVEEVNKSRSAAQTIRDDKQKFDKKKIKKILSMLHKIDINYVTATIEDAKQFKGGYIPTPLELYKDFIHKKQ